MKVKLTYFYPGFGLLIVLRKLKLIKVDTYKTIYKEMLNK